MATWCADVVPYSVLQEVAKRRLDVMAKTCLCNAANNNGRAKLNNARAVYQDFFNWLDGRDLSSELYTEYIKRIVEEKTVTEVKRYLAVLGRLMEMLYIGTHTNVLFSEEALSSISDKQFGCKAPLTDQDISAVYHKLEHSYSVDTSRRCDWIQILAAYELIHQAGLRLSELLGLSTQDFRGLPSLDITLHVAGEHERVIPLTLEHDTYTLKLLQLAVDCGTHKLFSNPELGKFTIAMFCAELRRHSTLAIGSTAVTPRSLRFSCAEKVLKSGASVSTIAKFFGCSEVTVRVWRRELSGRTLQ